MRKHGYTRLGPPLPLCLCLSVTACVAISPCRGQEAERSVYMSYAPPLEDLRTQGLSPLPQNLYDRDRVSLDGTWKFIVDAVERGLRNQYPRYTIAKDEVQEPVGGLLVEYDWKSAPEISVPGDWNTQTNQRLFWYEGLGWYRRKFDVPEVPGGARQFLYFEGANYRSHVYLNGNKLGVHEGGFTPFAFEVTGKLRETGNSLVVGVNSKRQFGNVPGSDADWFNYGGITRSVSLVTTPETYVQDYRFQLQETDEGPFIAGHVQLDGLDSSAASVQIVIEELGVTVSATTDSQGRAEFRAKPNDLQMWSPELPQLYDCAVVTDNDRVEDRLGFRSISTSGTDILLNGKPIYLCGISIHEERIGDHEDEGGRKLDWEDARRLLTEAKELGCNFVRLAHYPHSEKMIRMADELGLLVWSEVPVYQEDIPYADPYVLEVARRMQATNINRDWNRASIIVWSVANETPLTEDRLTFLSKLAEDARSQDGTRLISAALNRSRSSTKYEIVLDDPLGRHLDLLAYNTYIGWYGKLSIDDIPRIKWRSIYDKPMILSEYGTGAKIGVRGSSHSRWTEDYQSLFYEHTIANAESVPWIKGMSPWILKDFRSPRRYRSDYQNYWNRKGLISETGKRKQAWHVLNSHYLSKAEP